MAAGDERRPETRFPQFGTGPTTTVDSATLSIKDWQFVPI
jgi:hypothetical protein